MVLQFDGWEFLLPTRHSVHGESLIVEILKYAGFRQDVYFLMLILSKNSQRLVIESRHVLEPVFEEGSLVIERYLSGDKECI